MRSILMALFLFLCLGINVVFAQNSNQLEEERPDFEIIVSPLSVGSSVDNYVSAELRLNINKKIKKEKDLWNVRFVVPGIEFEHFNEQALISGSTDSLIERSHNIVWAKGYVIFRPERKLRPHMGMALGGMRVAASIKERQSSDRSYQVHDSASTINFGMDFMAGLNYYLNKNLVLGVQAKAWRSSVNMGLGLVF